MVFKFRHVLKNYRDHTSVSCQCGVKLRLDGGVCISGGIYTRVYGTCTSCNRIYASDSKNLYAVDIYINEGC